MIDDGADTRRYKTRSRAPFWQQKTAWRREPLYAGFPSCSLPIVDKNLLNRQLEQVRDFEG